MDKLRITKMFDFEMAHALVNYDGLCKNIHGHSYKLSVTVSGEPLKEPDDAKDGMVIDFNLLKKIVKENIIEVFDHSFVVSDKLMDGKNLEYLRQLSEKVHFLGYQPTCENLIIDFVQRIRSKLPADIQLFSMKLSETDTSYVEWFSEDNK